MRTIKVVFPNTIPTVNQDIPDRQVFYADSVGFSTAGLYVKLDGSLYPIDSGRVVESGRSFPNRNCPVKGYQPIQFQLQ